MSRVTPWAPRALASALVAAAAFAVVPAASAVDAHVTIDGEQVSLLDQSAAQVTQPTPLETALAATETPTAPAATGPNFTARTQAALRATRSASVFRWGTPAYAKWYAKSHILAKYNWGPAQYGCLVSLWNRESHWGFHSANHRGRTYGIPQTNRANIAEFGISFAQYMNTPELQVQVGAKYISYRYGSPCKAYSHAKRRGWY